MTVEALTGAEGLVAVCGDGSHFIQQEWIGDNTCTMNVFSNSVLTLGPVPCNTPVFPGLNCKTLHGSLSLVTSNQVSANASAYIPPRFDLSLAGAGLGSLETITQTLTVIVDHGYDPIPADVAPFFLPSLKDIFSLVVIESLDYNTPEFQGFAPPFPKLVGLPGLTGLLRFNTFNNTYAPYSSTKLVVQGTGMRDLLSFSGLKCPPAALTVTNNLVLASLNGLNSLGPWTSDSFGPSTTILGNNLTSPAAIAAISGLAGCPSTALTGNPSIDVEGCAKISVTVLALPPPHLIFRYCPTAFASTGRKERLVHTLKTLWPVLLLPLLLRSRRD